MTEQIKRVFNKDEVEKAVKIQKLAYKFLLFIADQMNQKKFIFSQIHQEEHSSAALLKWMSDYYDYMPTSLVPPKDELPGFANYFFSYLTSSFKLTKVPIRENIQTECYCELCLQMVNLTHLQRISPNNQDREDAHYMRFEVLKEFGTESGIKLSDEEYNDLNNNAKFDRHVAYLAYTKSLFERIEFAHGGVYNVALWRQFAWANGSFQSDFELRTSDIINSIERVKTELLRRKKTSR